MDVSRYVENLKTELVNISDKKKLLEFIDDNLTPKKKEKQLYGEVFTPLSLVEEMLDTLPSAIWSDPKLKFLEPGSGMGNFTICVFYRLMKGLKSIIPDESKREKHIIEKMLYMAELNKANIHLCSSIFKGKQYNLNLYQGDYLYLDIQKEWGVKQFDVIVGNPPYQKSVINKEDRSKGSRKLWDKFLLFSFNILKKDGYIGFINPSTWRKPENKLWDLMTQENQLIYLHIFGEKETQELFDVSQRVDLYMIYKQKQYIHSNIIDELGDKYILDLSVWPFLPNYAFSDIQQILTPIENGMNVIYDSSIYHNQKTSSLETNVYKYPIVHSITLDGIKFIYSDKDKGHFNTHKIIMSTGRHPYPINDYSGNYGMSNNIFGILIDSKKQGDDLIAAINSDRFKTILKATKWGTFQTEWRMFKYFKPNFYTKFINTSQNGSGHIKPIENKKIDKLHYILNNVYKVNISYDKFENKLVELGVLAKYIPKLWQKFYINKK
jgi:hypothetical protein